MNRKCDWCYFSNGSKKKITSWYRIDDDILFIIGGKLYLYENKKNNEDVIELYKYMRHDRIPFKLKPKHEFYIYRSTNLPYLFKHYSLIDIKNDYNWTMVDIDRIELREL